MPGMPPKRAGADLRTSAVDAKDDRHDAGKQGDCRSFAGAILFPGIGRRRPDNEAEPIFRSGDHRKIRGDDQIESRSRIDHAAAARDAGLEMRPRTVIVFGNPKAGTPQMTKSATLAIDLPMKALVWQDDQDKVWLTYNSSQYGAAEIYPRHGLAVPHDATKMLENFLADVSDRSTQ